MPLELLKSFAEAPGTSGAEDAVRRLFVSHAAACGDISYDGMGSALCRRPSGQPGAPQVMITAHMDEVGFAVQSITKSGYLKIVALGGWWTHNLLAQRVKVLTKGGREILGIIASTPPHFLSDAQKDKVMSIENLFVDVGAASRDEAMTDFGIALGDPIVPDSVFTPMAREGLYVCKAFDNRVGCSAMTQALLDLQGVKLPCDVTAVATVQEEVGCRGAVTAAELAKPDIAFVLEGTPADDTPGFDAAEAQGALGKGVQIRLLDPTAIMHRKLVDFVVSTAQSAGIPHQIAVRRSGGTDARSIQLSRTGVPCVVIAAPSRYIHSHNSLLQYSDYQALVALVTALLTHCDAATVASIRSWE